MFEMIVSTMFLKVISKSLKKPIDPFSFGAISRDGVGWNDAHRRKFLDKRNLGKEIVQCCLFRLFGEL